MKKDKKKKISGVNWKKNSTTDPKNPKEGDAYHNPNTRISKFFKDGVWQEFNATPWATPLSVATFSDGGITFDVPEKDNFTFNINNITVGDITINPDWS